MAVFEPPPTYVDPVEIDPFGKPRFSPIWLKWFVDLAAALAAAAGTSGGGLDHQALASLQGGSSTERYHLTSAVASSAASLASINAALTALAAVQSELTALAAVDTELLALAGVDTELLALAAVETELSSLAAVDTELLALANAVVGPAYVYAVAGLPSAATSGQGTTAFVTDSNATLAAGLGNTVVGGGANKVPVYSDGTNWRIG
jgi:hypothetical protein